MIEMSVVTHFDTGGPRLLHHATPFITSVGVTARPTQGPLAIPYLRPAQPVPRMRHRTVMGLLIGDHSLATIRAGMQTSATI